MKFRGFVQIIFVLLGLILMIDYIVAPEDAVVVSFLEAFFFCGAGMFLAFLAFFMGWADAGVGAIDSLMNRGRFDFNLRQDVWKSVEYFIEGLLVFVSALGVGLVNATWRFLEVVPNLIRSLVNIPLLSVETPDIPGDNYIKFELDPLAIYVFFEIKLDVSVSVDVPVWGKIKVGFAPWVNCGFNFFSYDSYGPLSVYSGVGGVFIDQISKLQLNVSLFDEFLSLLRGLVVETPELYYEKVRRLF